MNSEQLFVLAVAFVVGCLPGGYASAAVLAQAGFDLDTGGDWRSTHSIGSAGYVMFNTGYAGSSYRFSGNYLDNALINLPSYVSIAAGSLDGSVAASNFSLIDDPNNPSAQFRSGSIARGGIAAGAEIPMLYLTFLSVPTTPALRMGIFLGNADFGNPSAIRVTQVGNPSASASYSTGSGIASRNDYYFFNFANISAGDRFAIYATEDTGDTWAPFTQVRLGGLTFDSVVPEPSTMVLIAFGLLALRRTVNGRAPNPQIAGT